MKLVIREYLTSLKERGELDAILPDLLSELGYIVYSRPQRGTIQHGVDVAAVGIDEDDKKKIFLFTVKAGDLGRQEWDGTPQALRASLNEIQDAYILSRIPPEHRDLDVVICLCLGGVIQEQVRTAVTGYIAQHTKAGLSFREWNGDKLSDLLLSGILREEILPKEYRSAFQKAVAMVDEPDVSYHHFHRLIEQLLARAMNADEKLQTTTARQLYICLWIIYVWARDIDNVEAPSRISELVILRTWDLLRSRLTDNDDYVAAIKQSLMQLIQLHIKISYEFLSQKIFPHVCRPDALSAATAAHSPVDVNLKLFDLLGRIAMTGLWLHWLFGSTRTDLTPELQNQLQELSANGIRMIQNNSSLFLPLCDDQAIEIALFLILGALSNLSPNDFRWWLREMTERLDFTVRARGRYPCVSSDYRELIDHSRDRSEEYFKEATSGSTLIPLLAAWLCGLSETETVTKLSNLVSEKLPHCNLQLWLPDDSSEMLIYCGRNDHGTALSNLPVTLCDGLLDAISEACQREKGLEGLSASRTGYWPIVLLACRHYRLPVPPQFWLPIVRPNQTQASAASAASPLDPAPPEGAD